MSTKSTYIQLNRTELTEHLLKYYPNSFLLLTLISLRAKREPDFDIDLDTCESFIGDYKSCGLTRQTYRTALKQLVDNHIITTYPTTKGTIARLINTKVYYINPVDINQQTNHELTTKQPLNNQQANHEITTNNKIKNIKKLKNKEEIKKHTSEFEIFWKEYPNKKGKDSALKKWLVYKPDLQTVLNKLKLFIEYEWAETEKKYIPHGSTFVNQKRWEDEIGLPEQENKEISTDISEALKVLKRDGEESFIAFCRLVDINPNEIRPN